MQFDDPILNFVAQPENLETALDVAEQVTKIKEAYHQEFWKLAQKEFVNRLKDNGLDELWYVRELAPKKLSSQWVGCSITPIAAKKDKERPWLRTCLHQAGRNADFHLYFGFKWTKANFPSLPQIETLDTQMKDKGYKTNSNEYWPGWNWLNYHIYHKEFLVRMSQDADKLVKEIVDYPWNLFKAEREQIEAIHGAIRPA